MTAPRTRFLVTAGVAFAVIGSAIEVAIGALGLGWDWVSFCQSTFRNVAIALGVVVALRLVRVASMPAPFVTQVQPAAITGEELARELSALTDLADELGGAGEVGPALGGSYEYLDAVRWNLANYLVRGRRMPVDVASCDDDLDDELTHTAGAVRKRAGELAGEVQFTNTVLAQWLVAHRVAVVNPLYLDSNALFDRCRHGETQPPFAEDPLYLLVCHLHDVLEIVDETGDVDDPALDHLRAQLTLPLRAVRREVAAAIAHHAAAIRLTRAMARLHAG